MKLNLRNPQVTFVDLGDDRAAWSAALASQQVHCVYAILTSQVDTLKALPHLNIYTVTSAATRMNVTQKPFDNPALRRAMRLAIDSAVVLRLAHAGLGSPAEHHHVAPNHPEYAKLDGAGPDIDEAKKQLAEAGFPDGVDLTLDVNNDEDWQVVAAQAMAEQCKKANIRVKLNVMLGAQCWEIWTKTPFRMTGWGNRRLGIMVLGLAYRTGVPWNESAYSNPEFDKLLTEAEGLLDVGKRRAVMAKIEQLMLDDGPIVQPLWRGVMTAFDKKVVGFDMHPSSYFFMNELAMTPE